jgi:hypothetical protein
LLDLQKMVQQQQEIMQSMTNLLKLSGDTQKAIIGNIR